MHGADLECLEDEIYDLSNSLKVRFVEWSKVRHDHECSLGLERVLQNFQDRDAMIVRSMDRRQEFCNVDFFGAFGSPLYGNALSITNTSGVDNVEGLQANI